MLDLQKEVYFKHDYLTSYVNQIVYIYTRLLLQRNSKDSFAKKCSVQADSEYLVVFSWRKRNFETRPLTKIFYSSFYFFSIQMQIEKKSYTCTVHNLLSNGKASSRLICLHPKIRPDRIFSNPVGTNLCGAGGRNLPS